MPDASWHTLAVWVLFALGALTLVATAWITAPYGRHGRPGWGPVLPARTAWIVMESPAVLAFAGFFLAGGGTGGGSWVLLAGWMSHYVYRAWIYPLRTPAGARPMPVAVVGLAVCFNVLNAFVNAGWIGAYGRYDTQWLTDPRFLVGAALFVGGMAVNHLADASLRRLRAGGSGYRLPHGGLYRFVSCPNYLGEIIEWLGWAIATWSWAGLGFAWYTFTNLAPRAAAHHRWYRDTFPDLPPDRRALIPFVW